MSQNTSSNNKILKILLWFVIGYFAIKMVLPIVGIVLGGIVGLIGGIFGLVVGLIGGAIGLVFGLGGALIGLAVVLSPLVLVGWLLIHLFSNKKTIDPRQN